MRQEQRQQLIALVCGSGSRQECGTTAKTGTEQTRTHNATC